MSEGAKRTHAFLTLSAPPRPSLVLFFLIFFVCGGGGEKVHVGMGKVTVCYAFDSVHVGMGCISELHCHAGTKCTTGLGLCEIIINRPAFFHWRDLHLVLSPFHSRIHHKKSAAQRGRAGVSGPGDCAFAVPVRQLKNKKKRKKKKKKKGVIF